MNDLIRETAALTPDPERASKNLERLSQCAPELLGAHAGDIEAIGRLFAYSQFLAEYCMRNPASLGQALTQLHEPVSKDEIIAGAISTGFITFASPTLNILKPALSKLKSAASPITDAASSSQVANPLMGVAHSPAQPLSSRVFKQDAMRFLRDIKKRYLLRITLRDIMGITGLDECMAELSVLAEAITELALDISYALVRERFGELENNAFCVISLGKLGAGELNYSSDIDIMTVYESSEGISTGTQSASGLHINRIEPHEYYHRLTETLTGLLQTQTEDGIAYRVDLRLRPHGRKGELTLPYDAYVSYYEAWGQTWERMALIRARPVAGHIGLGDRLIASIRPFVWRRSSDFYEIEEIRELKKKIDTIFDANDIKRGYGGIREIEFFIQTFQLLYGGDRENLRSSKLALSLDELLKEGFLVEDDINTLSQNYLFLRRIEHVLQMRDDLQTHTLPSQPGELETLAKKLNFDSQKEFASELKLRRLMVRDMYNSLLGGPESRQQEAMVFLEDELNDNEIRDYLAFKGFRDPDIALKNIKVLNEQIGFEKTIRERTLLRKAIPMFLEEILHVENKDRALSMFVTFIEKVGGHESYIDLFTKRPDTIEVIVSAFSESTYFTRALLSLDNLESIFEYPDIRMDYAAVKERLVSMMEHSRDPMSSVREFKVIEELRAGLLFLKGYLDVGGLSDKLSVEATTIVRTVLKHLGGEEGFAVVGLGKFGAGELNIGSDLDLIFIANNLEAERLAEDLIRFISEYTAKGIVYEIDMRLRPDGSKGILVNTIDGYRNYYLKAAHPWEIQALLRARPVAGDPGIIKAFHDLKTRVILERGHELTGPDMRDMRRRIIMELSKESAGYDIKLGPGGVAEVEFIIQYLQLKHAKEHPDLITHRTLTALKRLAKHGVIDASTKNLLVHAYDFMRTIDTLRRINEETVLKRDSELADIITRFFEFRSRDELLAEIDDTRKKVVDLANRYYN